MLPFLPFLPLAQAAPAPSPSPTPAPQEILQPQEVRVLPGRLDNLLLFNSNSPELVQSEGILLSTFPPQGKQVPEAHLNLPLQGRFDVFAHHIAKAKTPEDLRTLYLGIILHNPSPRPITVEILQGASYLSQPDAPFIDLPPFVDNPDGGVYAGPGDRVTNDVLRGLFSANLPNQLKIEPGKSQMLLNLPIPVKGLDAPLNGRSTYLRVRSSGPVHAASLSLFAPTNPDGTERAPNLTEWQAILQTGKLADVRDRVPTPLDQKTGPVIYSRVAGVARGTQWFATLVDRPRTPNLTIPAPGKAFSYGLSTLHRGTFGTGQVQSAPLLVRYPDTAYQAHGNYGLQYNLTLPLYNPSSQPQTVTLSIQTPIKQDQLSGGLRFLNPPPRSIFFRGTVRVEYSDDNQQMQTRYVHLVQRRGQMGEPLVTLTMPPRSYRRVQVDFLYPPDATPPQVLTVQTLPKEG